MNKINKASIVKMLISVVLITAIAGGCTNKEEDKPEASGTPVPTSDVEQIIQAESGGEITISMRLPKTLNPLLNEDRTVDSVLKLIFEPIAVLDEYQRAVPNAALVESIDYSMDGFSVFITIREGAVWSDGTPITSKDIIFSIDTIRSAPDLSIYKNTVGNIFRCDEVSERSVKINLAQPFSGTAYTMCFPIIPEHYYKSESAPDSAKNMSPLGNGLYTFNSFTIADGMSLSASNNALQGRPYIDAVKVLVTPSAASDINSIDQKIINVISENISDWGKYKSSNEFRTEEYLTSYFDFVGFNFDRDYFKSPSVRQAIAYATPVDNIIEDVYLGNAKKSAAPVSPASWLYEPNVKQYDFDLEKAKSLLPPQEFSFNILVNIENTERVKIANILKDNLVSIGMNVEVVSLPFAEYADRLYERDYDMFVGGYSLSVIPDLTFAFHSGQAGNPADNQAVNYKNKIIRLGLLMPPEQTQEPTETGNPEQTQEPTETNNPEQTQEPAETGNPEQTQEPAETGNPEQTQEPAETGNPTQPNTPTPPPEPEVAKIGNNYMNYRSDTMDLMLSNAFKAVGEYNYQKSMSDLQKYIAEDLPIIGIGFRQSAVVVDSRIHGDIKPSLINVYQNFRNWFVR